jgi:tetratricopeptide (TPR) repeat protein
VALSALTLTASLTAGAEEPARGGEAMLEALRRKVQLAPEHSESWRLLGRLHRKRGEGPDALFCFSRAVQLDPENAAAQFDLAEILVQQGRGEEAGTHYRMVFEVAPGSSYARDVPREFAAVSASERGVESKSKFPEISSPSSGAKVAPASWEIQTFDGEAEAERELNRRSPPIDIPDQRVRLFIEAGSTWDSNVTLTPISRELIDSDAAAFKGFLSPEGEWIAYSSDGWRSGPLARGYFSVNEGNYSDYDLASFQPGAFLERDGLWFGRDVTTRLDYVYSLDLLGGERFGDRHAMTLSATALREDGDVIYAYATGAYSDFDDDGADPAADSLDGPAVTAGITRFFRTGGSRVPTFSLGVDTSLVKTDGTDFRYVGASVRGGLTWQIAERWQFTPDAGLGFRDYFDDSSAPARCDLVGRLGGKLRWRWTETLSVSAVCNWNRFLSNDEDFDSERLEAGLVTTFLY